MKPMNRYSQLRKLFWLIPALFVAQFAQAQQDPMYSMYMWNMLPISPGYAGSSDVLNVTAISRIQWAAIQGAPTTHALSGHAPINRRSLGAGASLTYDQIGRSTTTSFFGDIAYRMRVTNKTRLALGLSAGFNHAQIANTQVENTNPNDPTFQNDQSGKILPNFGFGALLWSKKGYVSLSVPKLLQNYMGKTNIDGMVTRLSKEATYAFFTAGYVFPLGTVVFKPATMIRMTEGAPISIDVSANFHFMEKMWVGAAYRNGTSVTGIFSFQITDQFRAGYAYDFGINRMNSRTNGAHEIMLSYDPVFTRDRVRSPRYF